MKIAQFKLCNFKIFKILFIFFWKLSYFYFGEPGKKLYRNWGCLSYIIFETHRRGRMTQSYYDVLEVPKNASESDIKKAYRRLSLQYHPDRNSSPGAEAKFKEINEAHETLSNANKRKQYDMEQSGHPMFGGGGGGPGPGGFPGGEFHDINDVFKQMFGGGGGGMGVPMGFPGQGGDFNVFFGGPPGFGVPMGGNPFFQQQMNKPPPIIKNLNLTLEQVYSGGNFKVEFERWILINNVKMFETISSDITVPPGIDESEVFIMRDTGNSVENQIKGDVKVCIQVENNTEFQRSGMDLIYKRTLTLKESLCGFKFELKHLNGKTLAFNNYTNITVIKPNYKKVVPNLGMTKNGNTGNLIIEFDVVFPDDLGEDQIRQLKEIL